jgi:hypothetical protein
MLDWWFRFFHSDGHLSLWNPIDHREFGYWDDKWRQGESYIGATTSSSQSLMRVGAAPVVVKLSCPSLDDLRGRSASRDRLAVDEDAVQS